MKNIKISTYIDYIFLLLLNLIVSFILWKTSGYFFLDNTDSLYKSKAVLSNIAMLFPHSGRFCAFITLLYAVFGYLFNYNIAGLFVGQLILVGASFTFAYYFMTQIGLKTRERMLIIFLLYVQRPFSENIFTIGKPDPSLTALFIFFTFLLFSYLFSNKYKVVKLILLEITMFFALTTKETAVTLIIPLLCILFICLLKKVKKENINKIFIIIILFIINYIPIYILTQMSKNPLTQGYTDYKITFMLIKQNFLYYYRNNIDMLSMGIISLASNIYLFLKRENTLTNCFGIAVCLWGWAYFCGMLLWRWPFVYYMIVPSTLFIISFVFIIKELQVNFFKKFVIVAVLIIGISGIQANYYIATSQIDVSSTYTNSMYDVLEYTDNQHTLFFENWEFYEEPIDKTNLLLNSIYKKDIELKGLGKTYFNGSYDKESAKLFGFENDKGLIKTPQIGDYVLRYNNYRDIPIHLRGISPSHELRQESKLVDQGYELKLLSEGNNNRKYWVFGIGGFWGAKDTVSAYNLYQIIGNKNMFEVKGVLGGNWISKEVVFSNFSGRNIVLSIHPNSFLAYKENSLQLLIDDVPLTRIPIDTDIQLIELKEYLQAYDKPINVKIVVQNTFVPSDIFTESTDNRELGLNLEIKYE